MTKYTICEKCPCLNNDYETGATCNLNYTTDLYWFDKKRNKVDDTPEMRAHQKDFDLFYASLDCGLIKVEHKKGIYYPKVFK